MPIAIESIVVLRVYNPKYQREMGIEGVIVHGLELGVDPNHLEIEIGILNLEYTG